MVIEKVAPLALIAAGKAQAVLALLASGIALRAKGPQTALASTTLTRDRPTETPATPLIAVDVAYREASRLQAAAASELDAVFADLARIRSDLAGIAPGA